MSMIRVAFVFGCLTAAAPAAGQDFIVDLAQHDPGKTDRLSIPPGTGVVEVINRVPDKTYSVTTTIRSVEIPALKRDGEVEIAATGVCSDPPEAVVRARIESQRTEKTSAPL